VRVEDWEEEGPIGTVSGILLGTVLGFLGGPAGMAVGAATGSLDGVLFDAYNARVNGEFQGHMARELSPGKYAVDARIRKLDAQIAKAGEGMKKKYRKRRDQLKANYERRIEKLTQAGQLTAQALS
jgi:uncharacterized membrane protein